MQNFQAAIFDMDGLLLDTERMIQKSFNRTCVDFNLANQESLFLSCVGLCLQQTTHKIHHSLNDLVDTNLFMEKWDEDYLNDLVNNVIPVKTGAVELLEIFKTLNIPVAVATSTKTQSAIQKLTKTNLIQYFEFIIGVDQVTNGKPDPEVYLTACKKINADPKVCIAFEDSENGVKSALAANMTVVQIPDLILPCEKFKNKGQIILKDLSEVMDFEF